MKKIKISEKTLEKIEREKEKCIGCKICMKGSPMLNNYCDSPLDILGGMLESGEVDSEIPYSCALCGYCNQVCPKDVDLRGLFLKLREDIVNEANGKIPKQLGYNSVKFHQKNSFSKLFSTDIMHLTDNSDTIFFPGCSLMAYSPEIVQDTYKYLKQTMNGLGIYLSCCGKPTNCMGFKNDFKGYYESLEIEFKNKNIKRVITACPNCFVTIRDTSPNIEVISLWETLSDIGVPEKLMGIGKDLDTEFTVHDPCPTRLEAQTHDSIRNILSQLGLKINEMKYNRENTLCCGSGGMTHLTNTALSETQMTRRAEESKDNHIISYCEECAESMKRGGKSSIHILDLLFNSEIYEILDQKDTGLLNKWFNRYSGKSKIKKLKD